MLPVITLKAKDNNNNSISLFFVSLLVGEKRLKISPFGSFL
jgi:hypothetical protein